MGIRVYNMRLASAFSALPSAPSKHDCVLANQTTWLSRLLSSRLPSSRPALPRPSTAPSRAASSRGSHAPPCGKWLSRWRWRDSVADDTFNRGQCGGRDWNGATCCVSGSTCVAQHEYYSQCLPGSSVPSSSTTSSSTVVRTTTTTTAATSTAVGTTTTTVRTTTTTAPNPGNSGTATYSGNPFSGVNLWANK